MFESNLADSDRVALPEAANDPVFDRVDAAQDAMLVGSELNAVLEGSAEPLRRRRAPPRFRDSGAALFRPFRIY